MREFNCYVYDDSVSEPCACPDDIVNDDTVIGTDTWADIKAAHFPAGGSTDFTDSNFLWYEETWFVSKLKYFCIGFKAFTDLACFDQTILGSDDQAMVNKLIELQAAQCGGNDAANWCTTALSDQLYRLDGTCFLDFD